MRRREKNKNKILSYGLSVVLILCALSEFFAIQESGSMTALAADTFPSSLNAPDEYMNSVAYNQYYKGVIIVFCNTESDAADAFAASNVIQYEDLVQGISGYGVIAEGIAEPEQGNQGVLDVEVNVPGSDKDSYQVDHWEKMDEKTLNFSGQNTWDYAVYYAVYDISLIYDTDGGTAISMDSYTPEFESTTSVYPVTLPGADSTTKEGYRLVGWHGSSPDRDFLPGDTLNLTYHFTWLYNLTAVWEEIPKVTVTYRPNGGTGTSVSETVEFETETGGDFGTIDLLSDADFTREGYTLAGWKVTEPNKTDGKEEYALGESCTFTASSETLVFDAIWSGKEEGSVDITVKKPVYVGTKFKYDIDKNSDGDVTLEFKKKGAKDEDYTKDVPKEPGTYTVRAKLKETDDYTSAEDKVDFEMEYLAAPSSPFTYTEIKNSAGTVTDLYVVPASGYSIGVSGTADAEFGASVLYSAAKKAGGVYLRRSTDGAITEQVKLTSYTAKDDPKITVAPSTATTGKIYYGAKFNVTATSLSPAEKTITYLQEGTGGTYTTKVPTTPGKYTARVTAPATEFYAAVDEKFEFSIDYLEAPSQGVSLTGTKGNGSWYTSDVKLKAPTGYLVSTSPNGTFKESIDWNENISAVYYQRKSDLAKTDAVKVSFDVKIDKDKPAVVFDSSLGISGKEESITIYADTLAFKIKDKNLKTVKVNNDVHTVSGDGEYTVVLTPGLLSETNTIIATDEAGNKYTLEIVLAPAWRQSREVPMGREVRLLIGEGYTLSSKCKLDGNTGDDTVYEQNVTVYVKSEETYSFVAVQGKK